MDAIETLKKDVQEGRIGTDRLVELVVSSHRRFHDTLQLLQDTQQQLKSALQRIEELEKKLGGSGTVKVDESYSMRAEEKRQEKKKKTKPKPKGRRGRLNHKEKLARTERTETVYPEGVAPEDCKLSHVRPVWRVENGRTVLVAYEIYRGPKNQYGKIPGVLGRSEFAIEIVTAVAFLVYNTGVSFDKACFILHFFQNLRLRKSQAEALMNQLAKQWEREFGILCTLLANSAVVHADETSWSLNSVWAFLSENARVLFFGVHKDAATLKMILDAEVFKGILISDDAAVYANFTNAQKCWAHLIRKAIKLALQDQENTEYARLRDRLLEIYRSACRVQGDEQLDDAARVGEVLKLEDEILYLCCEKKPLPESCKGLENDYRLLVREVTRLADANELFTFVTAKPVEQPNGETKRVSGTNNEAERTLRGPAGARDTGRTNKTDNGARRQTILTSVLQSLRVYLPKFTLAAVIEEMKRWMSTGRSCFEAQREKMKLLLPEIPVIDRTHPRPLPTG
jgi:transposase